jgi:hypothetical protein
MEISGLFCLVIYLQVLLDLEILCTMQLANGIARFTRNCLADVPNNAIVSTILCIVWPKHGYNGLFKGVCGFIAVFNLLLLGSESHSIVTNLRIGSELFLANIFVFGTLGLLWSAREINDAVVKLALIALTVANIYHTF